MPFTTFAMHWQLCLVINCIFTDQILNRMASTVFITPSGL